MTGRDVSNLERRYRALLRLLPAWYRVGREEEMVGIFLADRLSGGDEDLVSEHGWPGWGETWATVALSVRVRFGARRPAGRVARVLGLGGLVGHLVLASQGWAVAALSAAPFLPWFDLLFVVAFAALVTGRRAVGRVAAVLPVLWGVATVSVGASWWTVLFWGPTWLTAVSVLVGFHREAPPVRAARWWWAAGGAVASGPVWAVFALPSVSVGLSLWSFAGAWVAAAVAVAVARPWVTPSPAAGSPSR